jgi:predicted NBD/HSP70 family sugar kinase
MERRRQIGGSPPRVRNPIGWRYGAGVSDCFLALDITTARLSAAVIDDAGSVLIRDRVTSSSRNMMMELSRLARRMLAAAPVRPVACGIAWPGSVTFDGLLEARHMPSWNGLDLKGSIERVVEMPVVIESRGRASALAQAWLNQPRYRDVVVILTDEVVDAGIVADGRLLEGQHGMAGQIAHLVVEPNGIDCFCGSQGCVDAYVGGLALQTETKRPLVQTPATLIDRSGVMLARAIASLAAMVDSASVVLTGTVVETFGAPMLEALHRELPMRSRLAHLGNLEVAVQPLGHLAPLFGVAAIARSEVRATT